MLLLVWIILVLSESETAPEGAEYYVSEWEVSMIITRPQLPVLLPPLLAWRSLHVRIHPTETKFCSASDEPWMTLEGLGKNGFLLPSRLESRVLANQLPRQLSPVELSCRELAYGAPEIPALNQELASDFCTHCAL